MARGSERFAKTGPLEQNHWTIWNPRRTGAGSHGVGVQARRASAREAMSAQR